MKVIFLDVDGVLNDAYTKRLTKAGFTFVDKDKILLLKHIVDKTGAKVVLSSDWRYDENDPDLDELQIELSKFGIFIFDFTPIHTSNYRGSEIQEWLYNHPNVLNFVILDDRNDMEPNMEYLVQTSFDRGLTAELAAEAIQILGEK